MNKHVGECICSPFTLVGNSCPHRRKTGRHTTTVVLENIADARPWTSCFSSVNKSTGSQ